MAEICCGVLCKSGEASPASEQVENSTSRTARRRRMEIRRFKFMDPSETGCSTGSIPAGVASLSPKRKKVGLFRRELDNAVENCSGGPSSGSAIHPRYGVSSVCGRRRDMEDAVSVRPCFRRNEGNSPTAAELHYFGVFDGHGCSHVATKCRERLHEIVKEELDVDGSSASPSTTGWEAVMGRSFRRMDEEVVTYNEGVARSSCKCRLQSPECDAVGSTAVVAVVTPTQIVVANCGDSRAVLCRGGKAIPLSSDHKPDRPDELNRIQEAGGRVIYWDGPRVLGVLAMSRAIGDNYLKPYVSCEPEVMVVDRTEDDECLILASDGLWDVVSNTTACSIARMCLKGKTNNKYLTPIWKKSGGQNGEEEEVLDKACWDASMLLTKLALARHSSDNVSVVVVDLRTDTS